MTENEESWLSQNYTMSIKDIADTLGRSKSTISLWLQKYSELRKESMPERIKAGKIKGGSVKASNRANRAIEFANRLYSENKDNVFFISGLSLYWAEGTKSHFEFSNTDPSMITLFIRWCKVYLSYCPLALDISSNSDDKESILNYWKSVIDLDVFYKINIYSSSKNVKKSFGVAKIKPIGLRGGKEFITTLLNLMRTEFVTTWGISIHGDAVDS